MTDGSSRVFSKSDRTAWAWVALSSVAWIVAYNMIFPLSEWVSYSLLAMPRGTLSGESIAFFCYDVPKLLLLLSGMIFAITVLRTFFSAEQTRRTLSGKREGIGNVMAATLGIVTPFCSCSAVPLFIGFVESGIPLGVTFSFLIAAPMINEVALILLWGMFGWRVAITYIVSGMIIAIAGGLLIGRLQIERWVEDFVWKMQVGNAANLAGKMTWSDRFTQGIDAVIEILKKVWLYVLLGIGIGAVIHGYVPTDALADYMGKDAPWWSVLLVVLVALPLYSNAAGMAPVLLSLVEKGAALGTALAFMMAVVGVSLPETILLRRVLKPQLIAVFIGIVTLGIIITGYLFNVVM